MTMSRGGKENRLGTGAPDRQALAVHPRIRFDRLALHFMSGGVDGHATANEGALYLNAQANAVTLHSLYGANGEQAPSGPRAGSGIKAAGNQSGPLTLLIK